MDGLRSYRWQRRCGRKSTAVGCGSITVTIAVAGDVIVVAVSNVTMYEFVFQGN